MDRSLESWINFSDLAITSHMNMKNYSLTRSINLKMLGFQRKYSQRNISWYCIWIYTDTALFIPPQVVAFTYTTHTDWEKARGRSCYRKWCVSLILTRRFVKLTSMVFVDLEWSAISVIILRNSREENESTVFIVSLILLSDPWLGSTILCNIKKKICKGSNSVLVKV